MHGCSCAWTDDRHEADDDAATATQHYSSRSRTGQATPVAPPACPPTCPPARPHVRSLARTCSYTLAAAQPHSHPHSHHVPRSRAVLAAVMECWQQSWSAGSSDGVVAAVRKTTQQCKPTHNRACSRAGGLSRLARLAHHTQQGTAPSLQAPSLHEPKLAVTSGWI